MRDPYGVLGVPKNASAAAIKGAYRKLAKKLHPDANKQDKNAASKFAELNAAYEIVGDDDKRKAFDRGEIDAEGKPRFQGFEGFGARPGGRGAGAHGFETFTWGPDGFQQGSARRGGGGFRGFGGGVHEKSVGVVDGPGEEENHCCGALSFGGADGGKDAFHVVAAHCGDSIVVFRCMV